MDWRERAKEELLKRNITQSELAERLGVSNSAVSIWLNNKRELTDKNTIKLQYKIAEILDVSPEYLATGVNEEGHKAIAIPLLQSSEEVSTWLLTGLAPEHVKWRPSFDQSGRKSFYFTMNGSAMESSINNFPPVPHGSLIFIDPDLPLSVGKICLFQDKSPVIGLYEEMNNQCFLTFSNPRFPILEVKKDNFVGCAVGFIHFF